MEENAPLQTFSEFVATWNKEQNLTTPNHHKEISKWLEISWQTNDRELLLMAFRNSGKSTLVGLFCAWLLVCEPSLRIMVLAADLSLARKMTRNVKRIIERHPDCAGMKPKSRDQWASDQFTVHRDSELRDPSMLAKGIVANITGSRADVVICDDVEVPNTSDSQSKREDLRDRLDEIDYVLVPGGLQLYVGTPHTFHTIYGKTARADMGEEVPYLNGFQRMEIPIYDKVGQSVWPARFPVSKIESIRRRTGPNKFRSQMLLEPVDIADGRLDPEVMKSYTGEITYCEMNGQSVLSIEGHRLASATCWWDPSYGSPERGDSSVIACVFTSEDGTYWLHRVSYLTFDPVLVREISEAQQLCRQAAAFVRDLYLPSLTVETNGLGKFLPSLLRCEMDDMGISCAVVEKHSSMSKDKRILEAFDAPLAAGRIQVHRSVKATPFITEMREWRPASRAPDDGLDAVAGCLLSEPVRLSRNPNAQQLGKRPNWVGGGGQSFRAKTYFDI
ncbi:MAG: phage terminase large subunit [Magnetovibrio sp.]|nr:phage terminase large subunit [Magnetovibrio sp.]